MFQDNWRLTLVETYIEEIEDEFMKNIQQNNPQVKQVFTHIDLIQCQLQKLPQWKLLDQVLFLNLALNNIEKIDFVLPSQLIYLSLSYNKIKNFDGVKSLKDLQNLEALSLKGNPISRTKYYRRKILMSLKKIQILDDIRRAKYEIEAEDYLSLNQNTFKKKFRFEISQILQDVDKQGRKSKINSQVESVKLDEEQEQVDEKNNKRISFGKPYSDAKSFKTIHEDSFDKCSPIKKVILNDTYDSSYEKVLQGTIYDFSGNPQKVNLKKF